MEPIFDHQAVADLEGIFNRISQDSPAAARKVIDRLLKSIGLLTSFPFGGTSGMTPGHLSGSRRGCPMSWSMKSMCYANELSQLRYFTAHRPGIPDWSACVASFGEVAWVPSMRSAHFPLCQKCLERL